MPVGDDATSKGLPLVPDTGEEGRVRWGAREINRTRDFVAQIMVLIPTGKAGYRAAGGFSSGSSVPSNTVGEDGDWYARIL
jgi:hypothetical protein